MMAQLTTGPAANAGAFSLAEVVVAIAVTAMVIGSIITGYIVAVKRSQWTAMSEAAQAVVQRRMEQIRAARWDLTAAWPVDELVATNFPRAVELLYTPLTGANAVYCTNLTIITTIANSPPLKLIQTECHWRFDNRRLYTNSLFLYRSPDP